MHVPVLKPDVSNDSYSLRKFPILRSTERNGLHLDARGVRFFLQRGSDWKRFYFPSFNLRDKTVLDVGAGVGECCLEYLKAGASRVVCIENDPNRYVYLMRNFGSDSRVLIETRSFNPETLLYPHDFMKMNIGGYEIELLKRDSLKPSSILVHCQYLLDRFKEKGFKQLSGETYNGYGWMTN